MLGRWKDLILENVESFSLPVFHWQDSPALWHICFEMKRPCFSNLKEFGNSFSKDAEAGNRHITYQALQLDALPVIRENRESLIGVCEVSTKTIQISDIIEFFKFSRWFRHVCKQSKFAVQMFKEEIGHEAVQTANEKNLIQSGQTANYSSC